jgi:hypothetical protein
MAEVTFYHQSRVDGGQRSGLTVDGEAVLHAFQTDSEEEFDPTLEWFVDVAFTTDTPPTAATALAWVRDHASEIRQSLLDAAGRFDLGIDPPMPADFHRTGPEGPIRVSVAAMKRLVGRGIGQKLRHLAEQDFHTFFLPAAAVR